MPNDSIFLPTLAPEHSLNCTIDPNNIGCQDISLPSLIVREDFSAEDIVYYTLTACLLGFVCLCVVLSVFYKARYSFHQSNIRRQERRISARWQEQHSLSSVIVSNSLSVSAPVVTD